MVYTGPVAQKQWQWCTGQFASALVQCKLGFAAHRRVAAQIRVEEGRPNLFDSRRRPRRKIHHGLGPRRSSCSKDAQCLLFKACPHGWVTRKREGEKSCRCGAHLTIWISLFPSGVFVKCHKTRSLEVNREIARELLAEKVTRRSYLHSP